MKTRNRVVLSLISKKSCVVAVVAALAAQQTFAWADDSDVFTLGEITVTAHRENESPVGTATLDREQLWDFDKDGVADALNLIPGVATTPTAGAGQRNETDISVRGFDRTRMALTMDGIQLYLPADDRIDYGRFLTPDLSEIQVVKGYDSVINGPDGLGGGINLVTRKPIKGFEAEARYSAALGGDGQHDGNTYYVDLGSKQSKFYWQVNGEIRDVNGWRLSKDYTPAPTPAPTATNYQADGVRNFSDSMDRRANAKIGFTPNATDEYSINYVVQTGEKHRAAPVRGNDILPQNRIWDWPEWDTASIYWLSRTQLGAKTYLKTSAYYNTFDNTLDMYTNNAAHTLVSSSIYDDNARGFSVELGTDAIAQQTLKTSLHYRRDDHDEYDSVIPEPHQTTIESTWSLALEDTWHIAQSIDLIGGIGHDMRKPKQAQDYIDPPAAGAGMVYYKTASSNATNYQGAAVWRYRSTGKVHLAVSDSTRFPTIFERYSSRFGGATSNPDLKPERAVNTEIGIEDDLIKGVRGNAAIFYNKLKDAIESVPIVFNGTNVNQSQNVGEATFKGVELGITALLSDTLEVGGNYSHVSADLKNPVNLAMPWTATPENKGFLYAKWMPTNAWNIVPSYEVASKRWSSQITGVTGPAYVETGAYQLLNLKVEYKILPQWSVALNGANLLDRNYELVAGYPSEGRNYTLSTRVQF